MLRCHPVMCSGFQYSGYDYICYTPYLGLYVVVVPLLLFPLVSLE